ncbi:hypothetical protein RJT34_06566 [Clitoria ternatea]|uniref:PGG domain-containing protein n=1 Tax=Clitoria ternatea TaxID=43366 RepID=A0AAN9K4E6_CLITE
MAGVIDDSISKYKDLYRQVERNDVEGARCSIFKDMTAIYSKSGSGRTVLHVAVIAGHVEMVEMLARLGKDKLVKMKDNDDYTALALAADLTGNTEVAKCMVRRGGPELLTMQNKDGEIPVLLSAAKGHKEMTTYLYSQTPFHILDGQDSHNRVLLLTRCVSAEIFGRRLMPHCRVKRDVALKLLQRYQKLPNESLSIDGFSALNALAKMPSVFLSGCGFGIRQQFIYNVITVERRFKEKYGTTNYAILPYFVDGGGRPKISLAGLLGVQAGSEFSAVANEVICAYFDMYLMITLWVLPGIREMYDQKFTHYEVQGILYYFHKSIQGFNNSQLNRGSVYDAMLQAAKHGIIEFINAITQANPDLLWAMDSCKRGIFSYAILNRKQNVFQLIHTINGRKEIIKYRPDVFGNNPLHLAGYLGPSSDLDRRSGAALQMQREIQWFKAVEKVVHPKCKEAKNDDGKKPHELFTKNHEEMVKAGEEWAKKTSESFTIVGTLIITIMFAAAFTVPGGNNQDTGSPIFLHNRVFTTFMVADAVSLFTSATSVLSFIGILTSRYAEKDFLTTLPWKLLFGLVFLFLSVVSMIVAFCAALAMILKGYRGYRGLVIGAMSLGSIPIVVLVILQLRLILEIFQSTRSNAVTNYIRRGVNIIGS